MSQHQHPNGQQFLNKIENTREHMYTKIHPHGLKLCENSFNGGSSKQASYTCWWLATPTSPSPIAHRPLAPAPAAAAAAAAAIVIIYASQTAASVCATCGWRRHAADGGAFKKCTQRRP